MKRTLNISLRAMLVVAVVLFAMLSNHFPSTYGAPRPWLVLALLFVFGVTLKYVMNKRRDTPPPETKPALHVHGNPALAGRHARLDWHGWHRQRPSPDHKRKSGNAVHRGKHRIVRTQP